MNTILVSSHRRSGTHFLIDSLRKHIEDAEFPSHRHLPVDFNLGSLFSKDEKVYDAFTKLISVSTPVIIKSHLLPEECHLQSPKDKYEELIKEIFVKSKKLYISRDGKEVLISLYKFLSPSCTFSEFIRENNDHVVREVRSNLDFDANRVSYWSYHTSQWQQEQAVKQLSFSELKNDFQAAMREILQFLGYSEPATIIKPAIPDILWWQRIQRKLNHYGLAKLPESSSVRPNKRVAAGANQYFANAEDEQFFQTNKMKYPID